jgi:micrococcal nuclease
MHEYKVKIIKVVDGDTVDVDIDLGFGVWLRDERVRVMGIDTPESRTSDKVEKIFGLAAKARLSSLLGVDAILETQVHKGENMKGKFGRILGNFMTMNGEHCADVLMREGHAVAYSGGSKDANIHRHLENRQVLIDSGAVIVPEGMTMTKPTLGKQPEEVVENDPPNVKTATPKKTTTKKKTTKKTTAKKK